jgi:tight adherence protein B
MPLPILLGLIFLVTFSLIIVGLFVAARRLEPAVEVETGLGGEPVLLRNETVSSIGFWAELLDRFAFSAPFKKLVEEAGLNWSVGRCTALMLMSGASSAVVLSRISWLPLVLVAAGSVFALSAPLFYIRHKRQKRFELFEQHFPDALDSLGRAMRAGHAFSAGMDMVANEALPPVSTEIRKTLEGWRLGQSWDEALDNLAERVPLNCVSLFVASVHVQVKSGGKLHEILARISESLRESSSLDGEIRAISAHGRMTGLILTLIPIGITLVLHYAAPGHLDIVTESPIGRLMLAGAVLALIAAHFVMQKILDIKV